MKILNHLILSTYKLVLALSCHPITTLYCMEQTKNPPSNDSEIPLSSTSVEDCSMTFAGNSLLTRYHKRQKDRVIDELRNVHKRRKIEQIHAYINTQTPEMAVAVDRIQHARSAETIAKMSEDFTLVHDDDTVSNEGDDVIRSLCTICTEEPELVRAVVIEMQRSSGNFSPSNALRRFNLQSPVHMCTSPLPQLVKKQNSRVNAVKNITPQGPRAPTPIPAKS